MRPIVVQQQGERRANPLINITLQGRHDTYRKPQMTSQKGIRARYDAVTMNAAKVMHLPGHGIEAGCYAEQRPGSGARYALPSECLLSDAPGSTSASGCWITDLQEPDMPKRGKSTSKDKQTRQAGAGANNDTQKGVPRQKPNARAWPAVQDLHGGGKKMASGRKVPSGPVGGLGRKTNLARSS